MSISNLAVVHPSAQIGENVRIDPFAIVEADTIIGDGSWIGSGAQVFQFARLGKDCKIFPGAMVGSVPQDLKFRGELSTLEVGDRVRVREFCTLNRGTEAAGKTIIGSDCLLMAYVHVAHDCIIAPNVVLANNVTLAGHVEIGKNAVLGGLSAVHQFVRIGDHTMIGGGAKVRKDVPPFVKADRDPLAYAGINKIGLQRRGFTEAQIRSIADCYRLLFVKNLNFSQAVERIVADLEATTEREAILDFLKKAERGLIRGPHIGPTKNAVGAGDSEEN